MLAPINIRHRIFQRPFGTTRLRAESTATAGGANFPPTISSTTTAWTIHTPENRAARLYLDCAALTSGQAQLISLGDAKAFGSGAVNEFHFGFLRYANVIGQPKGGLGVSLTAQGFAAPPTGIVVQAPQFEGVENITFPSFVIGVPITNETQVNNTWYFRDTLSKAIGSHTLDRKS